MPKNIVKAKLDIIFKKIFSDSNNQDLLIDFISNLLDIPIDSISSIAIQNTEVFPDYITNKFSILDLKMNVDGRVVNIELQVKSEPDFKDRALFYWSKLFSGELKSGEEYSSIPETITINIVNFNMFDCNHYQSSFTMMEKDRHEVLSDKCSIHFFELKKINKLPNVNDRKQLWLQFINAESEEEFTMLDNTNIPAIKKAVMVIHEMSADEKIQELARLREVTLHDEASYLGNARREGIAIGKQLATKQLVEKMRKQGLSEQQIQAVLSN